jgi:hypothetical protein
MASQLAAKWLKSSAYRQQQKAKKLAASRQRRISSWRLATLQAKLGIIGVINGNQYHRRKMSAVAVWRSRNNVGGEEM